MAHETNFKESPTKRRIAKFNARKDVKLHEEREKRKVRARDKYRCRFPLCGCMKIGLPLHVSHDEHKGRFGAKESVRRSVEAKMVLLCSARHMDNAISRHKGTMRAFALTDVGYNGPVRWEIDAALAVELDERVVPQGECDDPEWYVVATETQRGVLGPLSDVQREVLTALAEMEW